MAALLVVDPDQGRAHRLRRSVESLGHRALVGHDVDEVKTRFAEGVLDLVLVDQFVGGGMVAFTELVGRMVEPVPFVMLSGAQSAPSLSAKFGAAGLLLRPFSAAELGEMLTRFARPRGLAAFETRRIPTAIGG